jgi:hypothetical protein
MDREEATRALDVLRRVVSQARDDTALQNWGVIWMVHGTTNAGGFVATNVLVRDGLLEPWPYVLLWSGVIGFNLVSTFFLKKRRSGARSFVETQLWAIWSTFIGAVALLAILNHVMGLRTFFLGPVIGILAAVCFAFMGSIMGARWFIATGVFALASIIMGIVPDWQFAILGGVFGVLQFAGGVMLHREKLKRAGAGGETGPRLV